MKKSKLLLTLLMIWATQTHAKQWSISNSTQNPGQFNSIVTAIANASVLAGDTFLLHPTATSYGNFSVTKRVVIIGAGFNTQRAAAQYATVGQITLASATGANGSKFYGLRMSQIVTSGPTISNITVEDCYITGNLLISSVPINWTVRNCMFTATSNYNLDLQQSTPNAGSMLISHCLFANTITLSQSALFIRNCVFVQGVFSSVQNAVFENCIFRHTSFVVSGVTNSVFNNCISASTALPTAGNTGNNNLPPLSVTFVNSPSNTVNLTHDYHLTPASTGYTNGTDGQQLGVFGGNSSFSIYGEPLNSAIIRGFNITNSVVPVNGTLNINATITKPNPQ